MRTHGLAILAVVLLVLVPIVLSLIIFNAANAEYSMGLNANQFFYSQQSTKEIVPVGDVNVTITMPTFQNWFTVSMVGHFHSNQSTPWMILAAHCSPVFNACGPVFPSQGYLSRYGVLTYSTFWLQGWEIRNAYQGPWQPFSPYDYPLDTYSTPTFYLAFNATFAPGSVSLAANIPGQFVATFKDVRQNIPPQDVPNFLRTLPGVGQLFSSGYVISFMISLIRSPNNLVLSVMYTLLPGLIIYEVCILSSLSGGDQKNRLMTYVAILFSVFAYFFTLRQFLPPYPTYIEGVVIAGMACWIMVEGIWFASRKITNRVARRIVGASVCALVGIGLTWESVALVANWWALFGYCVRLQGINSGLPPDIIGDLYKRVYCGGWAPLRSCF